MAAVLLERTPKRGFGYVALAIRVRGYRTNRYFQCSRIEAPYPNPLPAKGGEREKNHNPSTALVMMLRWISLEPP